MKSFFSFLFSVRTIVLFLLVVALVGGGAYGYYVMTAGAAGPGFRTEVVVRKNLTATISATGTIEPEEVVDIGSQVTGQVMKFGIDPTDSTRTIDYCTPVKKDTVLAEIDPKIYKAQVAQKTAALQSAQAALHQALTQKHISDDTVARDLATPAATTAQQQVQDRDGREVAAGAVEAAQANVALAKANLDEAQTNLDYCTIKAPVDGVIVDRRVNAGQTVVANLSAASLFLLAKDLSKVQVWASVNEADIGNIRLGQDVTFTVDARPGKVYHGTVAQVRLNATMTQNVVTYTVVVETDNPPLAAPEEVNVKVKNVKNPEGKMVSASVDRELLPYLTANLTFHVAERKDALLVPNAALRWRPQLTQVAPQFRDEYQESLRKKAAKETGGDDAAAQPPAPGSPDKKPAKPREAGAAGRGLVWVEDGTLVRPVKLATGLTDGAMTEVVRVLTDENLHKDDKLEVETALVTGENQAKAAAGTTNPFAPPQIFRPPQPKKQDGQ